MLPANFDGFNCTLGPPENMTEDECTTLFAQRAQFPDGTVVYLTCWKPTMGELEEIHRTGRVWVTVLGNVPPMKLHGFDPREHGDSNED